MFKPYLDADQLPDGVYLGLSERRYFQQRALGSTDLADLWLLKEGWWWKSRWNPWWKPDQSTAAKLFGSAAHCLLLEGEEAFAARYAVEPDPRHFPDLLTTYDDVFSALAAADAPGVHSRLKKKDLVDLAKVYLPGRHIWDDIKARFDRKAADKLTVSAQDRWELGVMLDAATADDDMRAVVTADGGVRLTEVSVFWTLADGVRLRFRFDSLLPALNADLKTLGNARSDLTDAVGRRIGEGALDVQAALSFEARKAMYEHIAADRVYFDPDGEMLIQPDPSHPDHAATTRALQQLAWLRRFPAEAPLDLGDKPGWAWCWMFFLKGELSGVAPTIFPVWMRFGSAEHAVGLSKALHGLDFYRRQVATVGLDKPWTRVAPMHFLDAKAHVRVQIPHWHEEPPAHPAAQELLQWRAS
jgi:hypothetical protein